MKAKIISITGVKKPKVRLIAMTGTPVSESPNNAYSLLRFIEPGLAVSKSKFSSKFVENETVFYGGQRVVKVKGYKNLDELQSLLANISIRRTIADVEGMPEKLEIIREVTLGPEQKKIYNALASATKRDTVANHLGVDHIENITLKLRQLLYDPGILGYDVPSAKLDTLDSIADEILEDDPIAKMVIWVSFVGSGSMERLLKRLKRYKPIGLFADTPRAELDRLGKTFDHSDNRIVVATPQKGGTGIDWLARSRYAVYVDLPWSYTAFRQSQDRLIRRTNLKSTDPIERLKGSPATLIELQVPGSVDLLTRACLERKVDLVQGTSVAVNDLALSREEMLSFIEELK